MSRTHYRFSRIRSVVKRTESWPFLNPSDTFAFRRLQFYYRHLIHGDIERPFYSDVWLTFIQSPQTPPQTLKSCPNVSIANNKSPEDFWLKKILILNVNLVEIQCWFIDEKKQNESEACIKIQSAVRLNVLYDLAVRCIYSKIQMKVFETATSQTLP